MTNRPHQNLDKSPTLKHDKPTTLNPDYPCDDCGRPAMVKDYGFLSCPDCWIKRHRERKKELDCFI